MSAEDKLRANVLKTARKRRKGWESMTELYKDVGGTKADTMRVIGTELRDGGGLEYRDGRIHAKAESDE